MHCATIINRIPMRGMTTPCRILPAIWKNEPFGLFMQMVSRRRANRLERMAMPWRKISAAIAMVAVITILAVALDRRAAQAQGQPWPQRPVHLIAPYAAGGNSDGIARLIAQRLGEAFEQTFVVENRLGANGAIATETVPGPRGAGSTLLWAAPPPLTINPALTKVNYDPVKDFAPISAVATNAFVLVVNKDFPPKTVAEFIAYVRAQPT